MIGGLMIAGIATASTATAQTASCHKSGIGQTQHHQIERVDQGVKSGELTRPEIKNIKNDIQDVRQDIKLAKADGIITPAERKEIKQDQRQNSREIYRKKHNNRYRG